MDELHRMEAHAAALVELKAQALDGLLHERPAQLQIHFSKAPFASRHGLAAQVLPALLQEEVKNFLSDRAAILPGHLLWVELHGPDG